MPLLKYCLAAVAIFFGAYIHAQPRPAAEPSEPANQPQTQHVVLHTSLGQVVVELFREQAPLTVANFLQYVDDGFYDGVIFHRVVPNFVVQVGGFDKNYRRKETRAPIKNESDNGLKNLRGTLSMARTAAADSATSQFFISLRDNPHLDGQGGPGYAVFGKVVGNGMDIIDKMPELPQGDHSGIFANAPNEPVFIQKAYRLEQPTAKAQAPAAEQQAPEAEQQAPAAEQPAQ